LRDNLRRSPHQVRSPSYSSTALTLSR
jgi:hypothetical protein